MGTPFNIVIVGQAGRVGYEAALFAASLRRFDPGFSGKLFVAEPQPGPLWSFDPRMPDSVRDVLVRLNSDVIPMEIRHFGKAYPYGNKIEALRHLPPEPFLFFDSDTLITGPVSELDLDVSRPSASDRVTGTWPKPTLYGPTMAQIWGALYDRFGLDMSPALDTAWPEDHWRRYPYFNAGWYYAENAQDFGARFEEIAVSIRNDPPPELIGQSLDPWLDQVALPLVIHGLGGGRDLAPEGTLDGTHSCHWRWLPLLFARESDATIAALEEVASPNWLKKVLKEYMPFRRFLYQARGPRARALFDRGNLPQTENEIRKVLRQNKLWER